VSVVESSARVAATLYKNTFVYVHGRTHIGRLLLLLPLLLLLAWPGTVSVSVSVDECVRSYLYLVFGAPAQSAPQRYQQKRTSERKRTRRTNEPLEIRFQVQLRTHVCPNSHIRKFSYSLVVGVCGDGKGDHRVLLGSTQLRIGSNSTQNGNRVDGCV